MFYFRNYFFTFLVFASVSVGNIAYSEDKKGKYDPAKSAGLASKVGLTTMRLWLDHESISIPPSKLPKELQSKKLNEALEKYETAKNVYSGFQTGTEATQSAAGWGFAILGGSLLYGGPQSALTVPLTILSAASYGSLEVTNEWIEDRGSGVSKAYIALISEELVNSSGMDSYDELVKDVPKLQEALETTSSVLKDFQERAVKSGDAQLVDLATDMLIRAAQETDEATLQSLANTSSDLELAISNFTGFSETIDASLRRVEQKLTDHELAVKEIGGKVDELSVNVSKLEGEVQKLGSNQGLVVDFMFSTIPAKQKVEALRSGLMDSRINCPIDNEGCSKDKIKLSLIDRYQSEVDLEETVQFAGEIVGGINDVKNIATDLGIGLSADATTALDVAAGAVNAYASFMTGNYLGAISSITGMFGKKKDPDAERFKIMMKYLQQQFSVVNKKLDAVLENQQVILDAVSSVSEQIQNVHEHLDGRLSRIEYEQLRISSNVKALLWQEWRSCYSVYRYSLNPNPSLAQPSHVDVNTLKFKSFEDLQAVIQARPQQTKDCIKVVLEAFDSLSATQWFGNFLDTDRAFTQSEIPEIDSLSSVYEEEANRWKTLAEINIENRVIPATLVSQEFYLNQGLSLENLFLLMTSDPKSVSELRNAIESSVIKSDFVCSIDEEVRLMVLGLICIEPEDSSVLAQEYINSNLSSDVMIDIADWMLVVSQIADFYRGDLDQFATSMSDLVEMPDARRGEEIISRLIDVLSLSISSQARVYGGVSAYAFADHIINNTATEVHAKALATNPYLAENTSIVLLHRKRETWSFKAEDKSPTIEDMHAQAYSYGKSDAPDRYEPLYSLYGREYPIQRLENGNLALEVNINNQPVHLPLPGPIQLLNGQFVYPPRYFALKQRRDVALDTLMDYRLGRDIELAEIVLQR